MPSQAAALQESDADSADFGRESDGQLSDIQPASGCDFTAWVYDPDPAGTNLRAGPGSNHAVLARIPRFTGGEDGLAFIEATEVRVAGARDGWFKVDQVRFESDDTPSSSKSYPDGWIHGSLLLVDLQTGAAFASPDPRSSVVAQNAKYSEAPYPEFKYEKPRDCSGEWVQLDVETSAGEMERGWARGLCDILETTCDGLFGDRPPGL